MPFGARPVLAAAFLFPAHASRERQASIGGAVRCGSDLGVLAEKTNESDAIFAKDVFVFLTCILVSLLGHSFYVDCQSSGPRKAY